MDTGDLTQGVVVPGLMERLSEGPVVCAEGYLFEFERRGYLQAGAFVSEIVVERPDLARALHEEFVHAGSGRRARLHALRAPREAARDRLSWVGEARIALEAIRAAGLTAVVTLAYHQSEHSRDGWTAEDGCKRLADAEGLGRIPPASRFSPDMSKHAFSGDRRAAESEQSRIRA